MAFIHPFVLLLLLLCVCQPEILPRGINKVIEFLSAAKEYALLMGAIPLAVVSNVWMLCKGASHPANVSLIKIWYYPALPIKALFPHILNWYQYILECYSGISSRCQAAVRGFSCYTSQAHFKRLVSSQRDGKLLKRFIHSPCL